MQKVRFTPRFDNGNGWYNILPPPPPAHELLCDVTADWLVIGAGYAGLSAARTLAGHFPDQRIALVEADRVGRGTAGRNAGFAIDVPFLSESHGDPARARRIYALHSAGQAELDRLVHEHGIDCQWSRRGKYMVAVGERAQGVLRKTQELLEAINIDSRPMYTEALKERLGFSFYRMGLYSPGTYLMNPAALTRGLGRSLPENVTLYENSPITKVQFEPTVRAQTAKGSINAKGVILATDGFTEAFGIARHRLFTIMTFASLTSPFAGPEGDAKLGGTPDWGVHPVGPAGPTIRRTQDNRIWHRIGFAYSGTVSASAATMEKHRKRHIADFQKRYPHLGVPKFEHSYAGGMCMTLNTEPVFQRLSEKVFVVGGQNGIGVSKGTIHGKLIADWAAGKTSELLDYARAYGTPSKIPREPFLGWGVAARLRLEAWKGRME
ncbi:FAD-binding oxidoreductase [Xinfangfangia sp. CPCC 101601]|uniref:FAD-binding oxidoreductase n=1 Tax=Pseudogemmobacter lacusdianii TaxID=3069608 RepID=A0ABU0W0R6_9RHOB|nr:FAD-binding oxidoreductase [Xinfangfangia sp. CPCC 101601]MDQ2067606.1 FAD-binding oxidoreductase [Xinfangfangia sp. CPCC 101601]